MRASPTNSSDRSRGLSGGKSTAEGTLPRRSMTWGDSDSSAWKWAESGMYSRVYGSSRQGVGAAFRLRPTLSWVEEYLRYRPRWSRLLGIAGEMPVDWSALLGSSAHP